MSFSETSLFTPTEIEAFGRRGLSESTLADLIRQAETLAERGAMAANTSPLTETEKEVLRDGGALGLDESEEALKLTRLRATVQSLVETRLLENHSLSEADVAEHLNMSLGEVRELALSRPPRLSSFLSNANEWRYPRWQFADTGIIPYLVEVLSALEADLNPVGLDRFMTTPSLDLNDGQQTLSPRDWLLNDADVEQVLTLVRDL